MKKRVLLEWHKIPAGLDVDLLSSELGPFEQAGQSLDATSTGENYA
jgi:hypothetical protein